MLVVALPGHGIRSEPSSHHPSWRGPRETSLYVPGTLVSSVCCATCNIFRNLPFFPAMSLGTLKFLFNVTSVRKSLNVVEMGLRTTSAMIFS